MSGVKGAKYIIAAGTSAVSGETPVPLRKAELFAEKVAGTPEADRMLSPEIAFVREREQTSSKTPDYASGVPNHSRFPPGDKPASDLASTSPCLTEC
jgi:hypothetical protein